MTPFLESASEEVESLTLETSSHCARAKAIPTTAHIGMRISVPRSGSSVASPIALNDKCLGVDFGFLLRAFSCQIKWVVAGW